MLRFEDPQSGNILFLILIAVALFAALSYAISNSNSGSGASISKDKARTNAAAILQYTTALKSAVTRLKITNGCAEDMFDFTNNAWVNNNGTSYYNYPNASKAPSDGRCKMFSPTGGNMNPVIPNRDSLDFSRIGTATTQKPGTSHFQIARIEGVGTDGNALTSSDAYVEINWLNRETCLAINEMLGVKNPGGNPPVVMTSSGTIEPYGRLGTTFSATGMISITDNIGENAFCRYQVNALPYYKFVHVLMER